MGAVRFLRVCRSPLKRLEVLAGLFLFHSVGSGFYEVKKEDPGGQDCSGLNDIWVPAKIYEVN